MEPQGFNCKISVNRNKKKIIQNLYLDKRVERVMCEELDRKRRVLDKKGNSAQKIQNLQKVEENQAIWKKFVVSVMAKLFLNFNRHNWFE